MLRKTLLFIFIILNFSLLFASNTTDFNITNNLEQDLENYQVKLQLTSSNVSEAFLWNNLGSDIRVTTTDNQDLNFWIEDFNATAETATLWVKIPLLPASGIYQLKLKYNQGDINLSNGDNTFIFFDDFSEDSTIPYSTKALLNADTNLNIPTYDGSGQTTHPSIIYFENGWNGYNYWMAITPYPDANQDLENPSIFASNDGNTWVVPTGVVNPIDEFPGSSIYNSDTELIYNNDTNELWVYYREVRSQTERINLRKSSDGINWGEKIFVIETTRSRLLSPTVVKQGNLFKMWVADLNVDGQGTSGLMYRISNDGLNWGDPTVTDFNHPGFVMWHPQIKYIPEKEEYWMLYCAFSEGSSAADNCKLYFSTSNDGLTWTVYTKPAIDKSSLGTNWDGRSIYRATFLYDSINDKIRVWYSANSSEDKWNTGYTEGDYNFFLNELKYLEKKWQTYKQGSQGGNINVAENVVSLSGHTNVDSSSNLRTTNKILTNNIVIELRQKVTDNAYVNTSIGNLSSTGRLCYTTIYPDNYWNTTLCYGYLFGSWSGKWNILRMAGNGSRDPLNNAPTVSQPSNIYGKIKYIYTSNGLTEWYLDDILMTYGTINTEYLNTEKYLLLSQGEYNTGAGGTRTIDYVFVRTYASTEPTVTSEINNELTLIYTAGENGAIDGNVSQIIIKGEDGTPVTAVPDIGHHFVNWSDGNTSATRQDTNVQTNISVIANFDINAYTVIFKDWNGDILKTEDVNYGGDATAPVNPTRTGYTFSGWSPSDFTNITADTNITAQYTINNGRGSSGGSRIITSLQSPPVIVQPQVIEIININENLNYSIQEKKEALEENDINLIDQEILSREEVETTRKTKAEINSTTGNLNVILNIKNKTNKQKSVSIVEIIPKEIADHIDKINFKIEPTEIINPDPIVLWKLNLYPNQDVNLEYSVDNITDVNLLNDYNSVIQNWMTPIVTANVDIITPIKEIKECVDVDDDPCTVFVLIDDECVIRKICKEETLSPEVTIKPKFNYGPILFLIIAFIIILILFKTNKKEKVALYYNKKSKKRK